MRNSRQRGHVSPAIIDLGSDKEEFTTSILILELTLLTTIFYCPIKDKLEEINMVRYFKWVCQLNYVLYIKWYSFIISTNIYNNLTSCKT